MDNVTKELVEKKRREYVELKNQLRKTEYTKFIFKLTTDEHEKLTSYARDKGIPAGSILRDYIASL